MTSAGADAAVRSRAPLDDVVARVTRERVVIGVAGHGVGAGAPDMMSAPGPRDVVVAAGRRRLRR